MVEADPTRTPLHIEQLLHKQRLRRSVTPPGDITEYRIAMLLVKQGQITHMQVSCRARR